MFDDHLLESESLLICRPSGTLNFDLALAVIEGIEEREKRSEHWFDRFIDMTLLDGISLSLVEMKKLTQRRREFNPNQGKVKAGFLAGNALAFATAKLYEMLLGSDRIEVRVFRDVEEAAEWLETDAANLSPVAA
jgi:hypothetical protein